MKSLLMLTLAAGLSVAALPVHATHPHAAAQNAAEAPVAPKLQAALRTLWQDHVTHTRDYALAVKAGDAGQAQKTEAAVVANAKQLSGAVAGFYGADAGKRQLELLAGHWNAVKALTGAIHSSDRAAQSHAMDALTDNAGEIATFLSSANPYLPRDAVNGLLIAHGGHHAAQIGQIMRGDMAAEQVTTKAMRSHMDTIADAMASALAKQFPDKAA